MPLPTLLLFIALVLAFVVEFQAAGRNYWVWGIIACLLLMFYLSRVG